VRRATDRFVGSARATCDHSPVDRSRRERIARRACAIFGAFGGVALALVTTTAPASDARAKDAGARTTTSASAAASTAPSARLWSLAPTPSWVAEQALDLTSRAGDEVGSERLLLLDAQVRVGDRVSRYYRSATALLTRAAVEDASLVRVRFDPAYQRLTFHGVRKWRDGKPIDVPIDADDLRVSSPSGDALLYDGAVELALAVPDLRVGDVIDAAYSIDGDNPIFGGVAFGTLRFSFGDAVHALHRRVLSSRPLERRAIGSVPEPKITTVDGMTSWEWTATDVAKDRVEDDAPRWLVQPAYLSYGEHARWSDVVGWALPLFALDGRSAALDAEIARIAALGTDPKRRALEVVRFVQRDIRYYGQELGPHSHAPHPPAMVLEKRFGDCKDKTLLAVTMLRALGIDAAPALVDSESGRGLDRVLPSPGVFDHVIVAMRIDGVRRWVDVTRSFMGGTLDRMAQDDFGFALVVAPGVDRLEPMWPTRPAEPPSEVVERYAIADDGSAELTVHTIHRGHRADSMRRAIASASKAELQRRMLEAQRKDDADAESIGAVEIDDRMDENEVVVDRRFRLPHFWDRDGARSFDAADAGLRLGPTVDLHRTQPIELPTLNLRYRVELTGRRPLALEVDDVDVDDARFHWTRTSARAGGAFHVDWQLETRADVVATDQLTAYRASVDRAEAARALRIDRATLEASETATVAARPRKSRSLHVLLAGCAMVGVALGLAVLQRRRARARWSTGGRARRDEAGETAAQAIEVGSRDEASAAMASRVCTCGASLRGVPLEWTDLRYGTRTLHAARARCPACDALSRRIFGWPEAPRPGAEA
jgi:transglutaminase-like putative cysteine protease